VSVETDHLTVRFSEHGSLMLWRACIGAAERPGGRPLCVDYVNAETDASSAQVGKFMPAPDTRVRKEQYPDGTRVVVESPSAGDRVIVREYLFRPRGYRSTLRAFYDGPEARLQVPTTSLHLDMSFLPEPMPGFSSGYAAIRAVFLADGNEQQPADEGDVPIRIPEGGWVGFRSRFWAMLATPLAGSEVTIRALDAVPVMSRMTPRQDTSLPDIARLRVPPGATMLLEADGPELEVDLYTGPVEPGALAEEGDGLESMLYSHVWFWIRPLSNGLRWILDAIQSVVGNVGLSIMLLSVAVKFLMWPLTRLAERWQAEVDRQHARIQPVLDEIRATWRGEERHDRTLAAYRERGISPLYATKSLFRRVTPAAVSHPVLRPGPEPATAADDPGNGSGGRDSHRSKPHAQAAQCEATAAVFPGRAVSRPFLYVSGRHGAVLDNEQPAAPADNGRRQDTDKRLTARWQRRQEASRTSRCASISLSLG
jgi:hypothetical protein